MKVIIIGIGRMGLALAEKLDSRGHEVVAIDSKPEAIDTLPANFSGRKVLGSALNQKILEEADINRVDAVVSCTNSDELNAIVARVAKNKYFVPKVIARLYDPSKAEIYRHLGIQTISTLLWGVDRVMELISYEHLDNVLEIGDSSVSIVRIAINDMMAGTLIDVINSPGEIQIVAVVRNNDTFIPISGARLEKDDVVYVAVEDFGTERLKSIFSI